MFTINKHFTTVKNRKILSATLIAVLAFMPFFYATIAHASYLRYTMVRFDRMDVSRATTATVCAQPSTASTEAHVQVTFPTGFGVNTTAGNWTIDTTTNTASWPTNGVAWTGIGTATAAAGQTVTFPSGDLVVNTNIYCFNIIGATTITTPSSTGTNELGSVTTQDSGNATIDTEQYATATVAANADTIAVSASVPAAFSFALSANTDALGGLSTASVSNSPTPRTITINTNAKNGWMVWAKDAYGGLCSPSIGTCTPGTTITSPQAFTSTAGNNTLVSNTQGYNIGVTSASGGGTGTISVATTFVGGANRGGGLSTTLQTVATSNGTNSGAVLTLTNNAAISPLTTSAPDYQDTEYFVGAGLF
jgi:hypothetical protein